MDHPRKRPHLDLDLNAAATADEEEEYHEEEEVIEEVEEVIDEDEEEIEEFEEEIEVEVDDDDGEEEVVGSTSSSSGTRKKRVKRKEYEVFIGGIPRDAVEEDIAIALRGVGDIEEIRLVRAYGARSNKGFAFVRFAEVEQARRAAAELRHAVIRGKTCGIFMNNENETLHLQNICTTWTKYQLIEGLKAYDLENLEEIHLIEHPDRKGENRGYAFLDFSTHMDAVAAFLKLQKRDVYLGTRDKAQVSFSITMVQDERVMAQVLPHVKCVFLDGLPASWDEDQVREHFKMFGEIDNIQLARNMFTARRKDFGFISFTTREAAMDCIEKINKDGLGEGFEKVVLKATLQRPRPAFKKPSWRTEPMLGYKRGYDSVMHGDRRLHSSKYSHQFPQRHTKSYRRAHDDHSSRSIVNRLHPREVNTEMSRPVQKYNAPLQVQKYSASYRGVHAMEMPVSRSRYGEAYPESRYRDAHLERRHAYVYPKNRYIDAYVKRRQVYAYQNGSSSRAAYVERTHRNECPCPECRSSRGQFVDVYQDSQAAYSQSESPYYSNHALDPCYECEDTDEYPRMYGQMESYDETDDEFLPSTSQSEHDRNRSKSQLQLPIYSRSGVAAYDEHAREMPDEQSGYEEYPIRNENPRDGMGYRTRQHQGQKGRQQRGRHVVQRSEYPGIRKNIISSTD